MRKEKAGYWKYNERKGDYVRKYYRVDNPLEDSLFFERLTDYLLIACIMVLVIGGILKAGGVIG